MALDCVEFSVRVSVSLSDGGVVKMFDADDLLFLTPFIDLLTFTLTGFE